MQIPVIKKDGKIHKASPGELEGLIKDNRIIGFKRSTGWVDIESDPVRRHSHQSQDYTGPERRIYQ